MRDYLTITLQLWSSGYNIQCTVYRADTQHGNMNAGHLSTDTWAAASEDGEYGVRVLLDTARRRKQSYTFQHNIGISHEYDSSHTALSTLTRKQEHILNEN